MIALLADALVLVAAVVVTPVSDEEVSSAKATKTGCQKSESKLLYLEKNEVVDDEFASGRVDDAGGNFGTDVSVEGCVVEEIVVLEVDDAVSKGAIFVELETNGATLPPETFQTNVMPTRLMFPTDLKSDGMNPPQNICEEETLKMAAFPLVKLLVDAPRVSGTPWAFEGFCHVPRQLEG